MITLTPVERQLRAHLLAVARGYPLDPHNPVGITYRELGVLADPAGERASGPQPNTRPPFRGLNEALGHISMYEVEHGRPMLSALLVNAETGLPGEGFIRLAEHLGIEVDDPETFWRAELADVVEFWASLANDPTRVVDAAVDSLYDELRSLRAQLQRTSRRPAYLGTRRRYARPPVAVDVPAAVDAPDARTADPEDADDVTQGDKDRFTDRARRVLVLAQEEARLLKHSFVGTEHILLGLIHEGEGVAAKALESLGISLDAVREKVEETIGMAGTAPSGSPPFTPRAKKVLELSLGEALQLGQSFVGTEHILLGLASEGEGVGAQVLRSLGASPKRLREVVIGIAKGGTERG